MRNLLAAAAVASVLTGCAGMAFNGRTGMGSIYSETKLPESATGNPIGSKTGQACASSILGWVTTGDASTSTAARNGQIQRVFTVDNSSKNILGIYATFCTVVTGE